jgi:hypothetical protein
MFGVDDVDDLTSFGNTQFSMSEYVKDAGQTSGWKTISYHSAGKQNGGE